MQSYRHRLVQYSRPSAVLCDRSAHSVLYIVHQQKHSRHHISHEWPSINFTEEHSSAFNGLLGSRSVSARDRHDFLPLTSHGNVDALDVRWMSHKCKHTRRRGSARLGSAFSSSQGLQTSAGDSLPPSRRAAAGGARPAYCQKQIEALFMIELNRAARQTAWKKNIYTSSLRNTDVWRKEMWKHTHGYKSNRTSFLQRKMTLTRGKKGKSNSSSGERLRGQNKNSDRESEPEREVMVLKYTAGL